MKSKANIKSHPIHPILVVFPIAFFTATVLFDVVWLIRGNEIYSTVARYMQMLGIGSAVLAAIAGIIDYVYTIPPDSSAKKRGAKHGLINTTAVIVFAVALYLKSTADTRFIIIAVAEVVGLALLATGGWMGGTLVYRNQIGVDIRYADAGKWKEVSISKTSGEADIIAADELQLNQMLLIRTPAKRIVLGKTESGFVAFDDHCTHKGGSLCGGSMICGTVQCPWHGAQFDVQTGVVKSGPAKQNIKTYVTTLKEGRVLVNVE